MDGGAIFGIVPKVLWQNENPADEENRIDMCTRCPLLKDAKNKRNILVDSGLGDKDDAKFKERNKIVPYALDADLQQNKRVWNLRNGEIKPILNGICVRFRLRRALNS